MHVSLDVDGIIPFAFNIARNNNCIIPWVDIARNIYSGVIIITRITWIGWTGSNTALDDIWLCVASYGGSKALRAVIGFNN